MPATHLVTGVGGQDGTLLARLLLRRGDRVVGTVMPGTDLTAWPYLDDVDVRELDIRDADGFARLLTEVQPRSVVNLAARSSVAASWDDPDGTRAVNEEPVRQMLAAIRALTDRPVFVQASSSDIFGDPATDQAVDEQTQLAPVSPYGEAKAAAHELVRGARRDGLEATNLVLFGHTSALQAPRFVLPTVTRMAAEVARGERSSIELSDPSVSRDWGSAHDVVAAMASAIGGTPGDYVIGTGELHSLRDVASWAGAAAGVDGPSVESSGPDRPQDFDGVRADSTRAHTVLGWEPRVGLRREIERMTRVACRLLVAGGALVPADADPEPADPGPTDPDPTEVG